MGIFLLCGRMNTWLFLSKLIGIARRGVLKEQEVCDLDKIWSVYQLDFLVDCYLVVVRRLVYPYDPLSYTGGRQLLAGPTIPGRSGARGQTKHSPATSLDHGAREENGLRPLRKTCGHSSLG